MDWLEEALSVTRGRNPFRLVATLAAMAQSAALAGDIAAARRFLAEADAAGAAVCTFDDARLEISRAWVASAMGATSDARTMALRAADIAARSGCLALEATALHDVARRGDARLVSGRLTALTHGAEGELWPALAAHAAALAVMDGTELDGAAERFTSMGMLLHAAEAGVAAAAAHRRTRHPGRARAAESRATALLDRCEGARTPATSMLCEREALTGRERQVATLASTGLTNREIALQLEVSVRTVDNLLHRAYSKLEVSARTELASSLRH